ncbi:MAG TPA: cation-transporting P-type ATPase, partial [Candidatus Deferrimicrobiaceae bacterium]|nr:cation-transporting P-type ATPase [Candidatus Deferrimicrobiaceae bacterium]
GLPRTPVPSISPPDALPGIHSLPTRMVYEALETRPAGLSGAEASERLGRFGRNVIQEIRGTPLLLKFLANFTHLMAVLLWIGGGIGFLAGMPQLGVAIWMVNLINGAFSFWQEYKAEKATEVLRRLLPTHARVLREGAEVRIPSEELVPGDVLLLAEGDHISADARLVKEAELRVDQSTLTGESHPARKTSDAAGEEGHGRAELPNLLFAGTSVAAGTGVAVVFATGMRTEFGKIARLTQSVGVEQSPLQKEMVRMTRVVTFIAIGMGVLFFGLAIAFAGMGLAESFLFAMGMIVAFVPEGLLPTVSLSLAMGVQRMARRNALVKRLSAVETLGCTTVICTDKTGTLTQNEMTVRELRVAGRRVSVTGVGYAPEGEIRVEGKPVPDSAGTAADLRLLLLAAGLCNNARLLPPTPSDARWSVLGDPTEAALQVAARKGGVDLAKEAAIAPRLRELPFESRRKMMTTIHARRGARIAYVKGAPNEVLGRCTRQWAEGKELPLTDGERARIAAENDELARGGLRVLAVAERLLPDSLEGVEAGTIERDLTFLGLMAMMDPPRPEVAEAVKKCRRAGIRIIMITGDYGLTAESVARRIGILRAPQVRLLNGSDLDAMGDPDLEEALRGEVLLARVTPEHKLRVVSALRRMGHVVAATGDGVNDAPALKQADIGVAMGRSGSDVAKEAADMVLADDNFASIVNAVEEGRAVYANIKKFIAYIFTSNTPEAVPFICFVLSGGRIPLALNVMQVLSIDLGTDIMPALALGAEPPEPGLMDKPPRPLTEHVITRPLLVRAYIFLGLLQALAAMSAFYFLFWRSGHRGWWLDLPSEGALYGSATAMALGAVVLTQVGNLFAQRTERASVFSAGFFGNRLVWVGIAVELGLLLAIVYAPFLQKVFGTSGVAPEGWLFLLAWSPVLLLADEARKALLRRKET